MNIPGVTNIAYLANLQTRVSTIQASISALQVNVSLCTSCDSLSNLKAEVESVVSPQLTEFEGLVNSYFSDVVADVTTTISQLDTLLVNPTDLGSAIAWINNMITNITGSYNTAVALRVQLLVQQAALISSLASLTSSLSSLTSSISSVSVTLKCNL